MVHLQRNVSTEELCCCFFFRLTSHYIHISCFCNSHLSPEYTIFGVLIFIFLWFWYWLPELRKRPYTASLPPQLMVSLLLCLLDWCMAVPLSLLLEPITMPSVEDHTSHKAPLLDYIYRVGSPPWQLGVSVTAPPSTTTTTTDCLPVSSETSAVARRHNNFSFDISTPISTTWSCHFNYTHLHCDLMIMPHLTL